MKPALGMIIRVTSKAWTWRIVQRQSHSNWVLAPRSDFRRKSNALLSMRAVARAFDIALEEEVPK